VVVEVAARWAKSAIPVSIFRAISMMT